MTRLLINGIAQAFCSKSYCSRCWRRQRCINQDIKTRSKFPKEVLDEKAYQEPCQCPSYIIRKLMGCGCLNYIRQLVALGARSIDFSNSSRVIPEESHAESITAVEGTTPMTRMFFLNGVDVSNLSFDASDEEWDPATQEKKHSPRVRSHI